MISLKPVILVEGKYDKIRLSNIFDTVILTTDGFGIFHQKDKLRLIRRLAESRGILIFTDSDGAGLVIRGYLKGAVSGGKVYHAYIPDLYGKEKRKARPSREGKLGVEGVPDEILIEAVRRSGAMEEQPRPAGGITKADLYQLGLSGGVGSEKKRLALLKRLDLPQNLSANGLLDVLNCITDLPALQTLVSAMEQEMGGQTCLGGGEI